MAGLEERELTSEDNGSGFTKQPHDELIYWITERERVRILKEGDHPKPWSDDPVFQSVYFCNVRREDDKVTRWIRTNWSHPEHHNFVLAMCVARIFNYPGTLGSLGFPYEWDPDAVRASLRAREWKGMQIWSGAYVITTHGRKMSKIDYCVEVLSHIAQSDINEEIADCTTLAEAHKVINQYEGFGSFLAAQVVADLKNTPGHHLNNAEDWWEFSAPGPGSLRGLKWLYGDFSPSQYQTLIRDTGIRIFPHTEAVVGKICAQDLQNCLCEFDKYMRVKNGTGRSKRRYNGV